MTVLIASQNAVIFKQIHPSVKFYPSSANTMFFKCTEKTFIKIRNEVRLLGFNPFALMYWY